MLIAIYILIILVSLVLERQERRHQFEQRLEYERLHLSPPAPKPKLPLLESWLNVLVGLFLFSIGALVITNRLVILATEPSSYSEVFEPVEFEVVTVFLAGGIALMILGWKSVKLNRAYRKETRTSD
jgi:hypothetical protein